MSMNSREDFIAAMISELSKQKTNQGNTEQFFTGNYLTANEVFRKLCFDYPLIDDQALQILLVGLKTIRQTTKSVDFRSYFFLHKKFLDNIAYLIHDIDSSSSSSSNPSKKAAEEDDSDNEETNTGKDLNFNASSPAGGGSLNPSSQAEPSKRGKVLAQVSAEIYLQYPNYFLKLPKRELISFFSQDSSHLFSPYPNTGRMMEELSWTDILIRFRNYLIKSNVTLIVANTDAKTLTSTTSMSALLELIVTLRNLVMLTQDSSENSSTIAKLTSQNKANENMTVIEYLENQFAMYKNRKQANSSKEQTEQHEANEDDLQAEQLIAMVKEMWTHVVYLYIDTICHIPELLSTQFMPLAEVLLQVPEKQKPSSGNIKVGSQPTMEDLFFNNSAKPSAASSLQLPTPSQYLGLMMISNISNHLTKELELGHHLTLLRTVKEDIRKYFANNDTILTHIVSICEQIQSYNNQHILADSSNQAKKIVIDLESANFFLDVAELIIYPDRLAHSTSIVAGKIMNKLISSRLLSNLMINYVGILEQYQASLQADNNQETSSQNGTAQLWLLSCR